MKKHLHQKIRDKTTKQETLQKSELMKSDETTVFFNFIRFDVCSFSCRKQLDFFGWRFLFEIAFGRDFFGWTFWVEVPPQI